METVARRTAVAQRGKSLEYFAIGWNILEGLVAVLAGSVAGSILLRLVPLALHLTVDTLAANFLNGEPMMTS